MLAKPEHLALYYDLLDLYQEQPEFFRKRVVFENEVSDLGENDYVPVGVWSGETLDRAEVLLRHRKIGRLFLNGGMATRMNSEVKGLLPLFDTVSFVEVKIKSTLHFCQRLGIPEMPLIFLNSAFTHEKTLQFLKQHQYFGYPVHHVHFLVQKQWPRFSEAGKPEGERLGYASCGHGDFLELWLEHGSWLSSLNLEMVDISNIDNVLATPHEGLYELFYKSACDVLVEIADRKQDKGGAAVLYKGRPMVVEGPYFDGSVKQERYRFLNTNNVMMRVSFLERQAKRLKDDAYLLPWNVIQKEVDGSTFYQFERFLIDLVRLTDEKTLILAEVGRGIALEKEIMHTHRFLPLKTFQDLEHYRLQIREWYRRLMGEGLREYGVQEGR